MIFRWFFIMFFILACLGAAGAQGLLYLPPQIERYHPLSERVNQDNPLATRRPAILKENWTIFQNEQVIDFENREISFKRSDALGTVLWEYRYGELDRYIRSRNEAVFYALWYNIASTRIKETTKKKDRVLEFEMPVQYPTWAQRILGKEPPRLTIDGSIKLIVDFNNEKIGPKGALESKGDKNVNFDQEYRFKVQGSVGRLIDLSISATSEQSFDNNAQDALKNFKVEYKGEGNELEDEIVQEVLLGYTSFSLPNTQLSGYSGSKEGLFGAKIVSKLGPLSLTTVISAEQGESKKMPFPKGGSNTGTDGFTEKDFIPYRFFFLDTMYQSLYNNKRTEVPKVEKIEVWRMIDSTSYNGQSTDTFFTYKENRKIFLQLQEGKELGDEKDYILDRNEGWIRFGKDLNIDEQTVIGIYMKTSDLKEKGKMGAKYPDSLWILKEQNPSPGDGSFYLAWRNVYSLGAITSEYPVKVKRIEDNVETSDDSPKPLYSYLLGLTDIKGNSPITNQKIYDVAHGYLILPPIDTFGSRPFASPKLGRNATPNIYDSTLSSLRNHNSQFKIMVPSGGGGSNSDPNKASLGFGVKPESEIVNYESGRLTKNIDYTIDYDYGEIVLISPRAINAKNVTIEYQSDAFMPQSKVFLGARAELKFPDIGTNSFWGTSVLWQKTTTSERIPRVGSEPYSRLLLDMNTSFDFEPDWMTALVDLIPFIETDQPSKVNLSVEVAHSLTFANSDGEAYLDDFESVQQNFPLTVQQTGWYQASPPKDIKSSLLTRPPAWFQFWYTPVDSANKVLRSEIWNIEAGQESKKLVERYEDVLRWVCKPRPENELKTRYKNPWAGITAPLPAIFSDRQGEKYLEFWANCPKGKLHIDFGEVSEDLSLDGREPSGGLNREDSISGQYPLKDDKGLDMLVDAQEVYYVPNDSQKGWISLPYGDPLLKDSTFDFINDPHRDNYKLFNADKPNLKNFPYVNGTQGDAEPKIKTLGAGAGFSSEDINRDGFSVVENFFRRSIDFSRHDSTNFYVKASNEHDSTTWRLYRVPLNNPKVPYDTIVGKPEWRNVRNIRLWWEGFDSLSADMDTMQFAQMQFVGNQWTEQATINGHDTTVKIEASVVKSEDNATYRSDPPVERKKDLKSDTYLPEQSLRLTFKNLLHGEQTSVLRILSEPADLSAYRDLRLLLYGDQSFSTNSDLWYFFRFGTQDSVYYEYRTKIRTRWNKGIVIDLKELSDVKLAYLKNHGDTVSNIDTSIVKSDYSLRIRAIKGMRPNFASIRWMSMGIWYDSAAIGTEVANGEIWVDELKATGIRSLQGWAALASMSTSWADLATMSGTLSYRDGNFRQLTDQPFPLGGSSVSGSLQGNMQLAKFLPQESGVSLPLDASISTSINRPQLKPGTDIYLAQDDGNGDGLIDLLSNDTTPSSHYESRTFSRSINASYKKTASDNLLVSLFAERIGLSAGVNQSITTEHKGEKPNAENKDFLKSDTSTTYTGRADYDLTPIKPPAWTRWKPFAGVKRLRLPKPVKDWEFTFLPNKLTAHLFDLSYSRQKMVDQYRGESLDKPNFSINHGAAFGYSPWQTLKLNYTISLSRDLKEILDRYEGWDLFQHGIADFSNDDGWASFGVLRGELNRTQNFSIDYDPSLVEWLTHSFGYTSAFSMSPDQNDSKRLSVNGAFNFSSGLQFNTLLQQAVDATVKMPKFSGSLKLMQKAFSSIDFSSINFTYSATSATINNRMTTAYLNSAAIGSGQLFAYKLGKPRDRTIWDVMTGDFSDETSPGAMKSRIGFDSPLNYANDSRSTTRTYSTTTSFKLPSPLSISLSFSLGSSIKVAIPADNLKALDTTRALPEITVDASTDLLQQLSSLSLFFKSFQPQKALGSLALTSKFKYSRLLTKSVSPTRRDSTKNIEWGFAPLVGLTGSIKELPLTFSYSYDISGKHDVRANGEDTASDFKHSASIDYHLAKSTRVSEIKLLWWSVPLVGQLAMGVSFEYSGGTYNTSQIKGGESSKISVGPHLNYDFTDNVKGELNYTYSHIVDQAMIERQSHNFSLIIEILFK